MTAPGARAPGAYHWTDEQKETVAYPLLACPGFADPARWRRVRALLPFPAPGEGGAADLGRALRLLRAGESHPRGLPALIDALMVEESEQTGSTETLPPALRALTAALQRVLPQPVTWEEMARLRALLPQWQAPAAILEGLCRRVLGTLALVPAAPPGEIRLLHLLDALAATADARGARVLLEFLTGLRASAAADPGAGVEGWMEAVAARTGVGLDALRAGEPEKPVEGEPRAEGENVLLIRVMPDDQDETAFSVNAWLFRDGAPPTEPPPPIRSPATRKKLPQNGLADAIEELATTVRSDNKLLPSSGAPLRLEVLLPLGLLDDDIDERCIKVGRRTRRPLGTEFVLAVRSWDRLYDSELLRTWARWKVNFARLPQKAGCVAETHVHWGLSPEMYEDLDKLYDDLRACGLAFCGVVPPPADGRRAILETLLDAGVPIALWHRVLPADPAGAEQSLRGLLLQKDPERLAARLQTLRDEADKARRRREAGEAEPAEQGGALWQRLVLMWDDPNRLPPDRQSGMQAVRHTERGHGTDAG